MLTEVYNAVLPGMEDLHIGLRQCQCECGCGETFWAKRVGRVPKYMNKAHKAKAYRNKKGAIERFDYKSSAEGFSSAVQEALAQIYDFENNEAAKEYAAFYLDTVKGLLETALEKHIPY